MKKNFPKIIIILTLITGLSLILYPTVSDILKTIASNNAISEFQSVVDAMDPAIYDDMLEEAREFNAKLSARGALLPLNDYDKDEYERLLRLPGTDVMGYLVIPKINVSLPIYHGTSDAVLQNGVGHMEGTSLPVGGDSTHAALAAHRGLPSARLFTDLDRVELGDTFTIHVLKEVLTYEVDDIHTVLPEESQGLAVEQGRDYCTLVTCTPYGINSHRLLVRGHRIPTPVGETETPNILDEVQTWWWIIAIVVVLIAAGIVTWVLLRKRAKKRREQKESPK